MKDYFQIYTAVQYDSENGLRTWFDAFKVESVKVSDEINDIFKNIIPKKEDKIGWGEFNYDLCEGGIDDFIDKYKIADENFKEFLGTVGNSKFTMQDYQQWLVDNGRATTEFGSLTKKAGTALKSLGASLLSMVAMWAIGEVIGLAMTAIENYVNRVKYAQDALDEAKSNFDSSTSEIESLNGELETTQSRMEKLQNLADNGTISVTEEKELENLKEQNAELERSIYLEKLKAKNSAKEELENAKVIADEKVISKYGGTEQEYTSLDYNTKTSSSEIVTHKYTSPDFVTNSKELQLATNRLKELQKERQDLIDQYNNGTLDAESYDQKISPIEKEIEDTETYAAGLYDKVGDIKQAGDDATAVNRKMSSSFKESYKEATQAVADYDSYIQDNTDSLNVNTDAAANNAMSKNNNDSTTSDSKPKPIAFKEAWNNLDTTDNDNYKNIKSTLTSLAESGQLTVEAFKNTDGATAWAESIGLSAEEATKKINDLTDSSKQLSTLKTAMDSIQNAYSEKSENGIVGADTLSSMESTFGNLGDSWEKYKQVAGSAKTDTNDLKKAQDELATAYINSNNFLSGLVDETGKCTEANRQYYIGQLEELGIKNAESVVDNAILKQKAEFAVNSINLANATADEIAWLANENNALGESNEAYKNYIFYKSLASENALNTTDSIQNLINLAKQCNVTGEVLYHLNSLLNAKKGYEEFLNSGGSVNDPESTYFLNTIEYNEQWIKTHAETNNNENESGNKKADTDTKNTAPPTQPSAKSTASTKQEIDWIDRRVSVLTSKISLLNAQKENLFTVKKKNSNLKEQIKQTTQLIKTYAAAYNKYMEKANSVELSKDLKKKVRSGQIKGDYNQLIKEYGEDTAKNIEFYKKYYDLAQSAKQKKAESRTSKRQLQVERLQNFVDKFNAKADYNELRADNTTRSTKKRNKSITNEIENVKSSYNNQIKIATKNKDKTEKKRLKEEKKQKILELKRDALDNTIADRDNKLNETQSKADSIQSDIDTLEARGVGANTDLYKNLSQNADEQKNILKSKNDALNKYLKDNKIKKGTEEWYEIQKQIDENNASVKDLTKSQIEWNNTIQKMRLDKFKNLSDLLGGIKSKFQALIGLNSAQGYTESDADILKEIRMGNNQIATNKEEINQQWANIIEDATKSKSDDTGWGWGLSTDQADKFKSSYQKFLNGDINQTQFEEDLKSLGLTWEQIINNSELREGIQNINELETENLNLMESQEQKYDEIAQKRIDAINDYIDKLKKANDAKSKAIELEKLQQKLQEAKQNKTTLVYREGYGFNYEADQSAINDAQSALDDAQFDSFIDKLTEITEILEENKDDFNLYMKNSDSLGNPDTLIKNYLASLDGILASESLISRNDTIFTNMKQNDILLPNAANTYAENMQKQISRMQSDLNLIQPQNTGTNNLVQIENVSLPNINDASSAQELFDGLITIGSDAIQRANKR